MHMDCDERLKLGSLHLRQISRRLVDQHVEQLQEVLIGLLHDFTIILGIFQRLRGVTGPYQLDA